MALINLSRICGQEITKCTPALSKITRIQSATIMSKELREPNPKKPKPFPYQDKRFTLLHSYYHSTLDLFDENSKIIIVDGNIGAGKTAFARQLADAFDMKYVPEPDMEEYFINPYGFDIRKIDELLPPSFKCCDVKTFYQNPFHQNVPKMQFRMYMLRLRAYINALAHLLNTGQGIVMERSPYADFVFVEAMYKAGYIRREAREVYQIMCEVTLDEILQPHLIIYLDINPDVALERIKKRGDPIEVNSKVLTRDYLATIDHNYRRHYLPEMEKHAEVLIYDWSHYGDVEVVVEDIERLDFDQYDHFDKKLADWRKEDDWEWNYYRRRYTNEMYQILGHGLIWKPEVSELFHSGEDTKAMDELLDQIPGEKYAVGFNADCGDSVWFKTKPTSKSWRDFNTVIRRP